MSILETYRGLNNHTLLSQIPSFFRAYSIPPIFFTKSNRPEKNKKFSDNCPWNTEHEDITSGESYWKLLDQDQEGKDDSDGVQEVDSEEQDTIR